MATEEIERCYEAEYARLVGVVTVVTGSNALAEEAVQEAFARALDRSRRGLVLEHVGAWVVTVALNEARSGRRRRAVERRALQRVSVTPPPASLADRTEAVVLRAAIEDLPGRQQDAVVLYYLLDLDVATTALVLGVAPGTVKTALHRARAHLLDVLGDREMEA
jgi:RNA polymerase sigma factor (sigma-70 family)